MTLHGLRYKPHSPSLFELEGYPVAIIMDQNRKWHIWNDGMLHPRTLGSRELAAEVVARAFEVRP